LTGCCLQTAYQLCGTDQDKLIEATLNSFDLISLELQPSFFVTTYVLLISLYRSNNNSG